MAANGVNNPFPAPNIFDIYRDERVPQQQAVPGLPRGSCNYVDLSPGANGARCGCRRFWPRQSIGDTGHETIGWCMCAHHACFHEDGNHNAPPQKEQACINSIGQENGRPRTGREVLSPVVDMTFNGPSPDPEVDFAAVFSPGAPLSFVHDFPAEIEDKALLDSVSRPPVSLPDTLAWDEYIQSPTGLPEPAEPNALPPIPSQCLMFSQTASTTSSMQAKYKRPFAGKGLGTLNILPDEPVRSLPKQHGRAIPPMMGALPAPTHPHDSFSPAGHDGQGPVTPRSGTATQTEPRTASALHDFRLETLRNFSDTISSHEQRLDRLETVSFSATGHEECLDKHDHMDLRVTDLEQRMEGVEKAVAADTNSTVHGKADREDDVAGSFISGATSVASHANPEELISQIVSLKHQVSQLQAFLPSQ